MPRREWWLMLLFRLLAFMVLGLWLYFMPHGM